MNKTLFDVDCLQERSIVRCRKWSSFMENYSEDINEELSALDIENCDSIYVDEVPREDEDDLAYMEEEVDEEEEKFPNADVLRDITNSILGQNNAPLTKDSTIAHDNSDELVDFLNETVPVLSEHTRQLKEHGIDRILNTFDSKKIEAEVGTWLNRHTLSYVPPEDLPLHNRGTTTKARKELFQRTLSNNHNDDDDTDSDDSFQSGETARYIRSSRACTAVKKSSSPPTMIIKTYRKVKSSRQALKAKYAWAEEDEDAERHLKQLRHRRRLANKTGNCQPVERCLSKSHHSMQPFTMTPLSSCTKKKRKVLRLNTCSNSCSTMNDSSSDSENSYFTNKISHKSYHHQRQYKLCARHKSSSERYETKETTIKVKRVKKKQKHFERQGLCNGGCYCAANSSNSSSLSISPLCTTKICQRSLKCLGSIQKYKDRRPIRLESKCSCYKKKTVCQKYRHLSDMSTEEWYVENSFTVSQAESSDSDDESVKRHGRHQASPPKMSKNKSKNISKNKSKPAKGQRKTKKQDEKGQAKTKKQKDEKETTDDSFERNLQLALKESKELYEKEVKPKQKHVPGPPKPLEKKLSKESSVSEKSNIKRHSSKDAADSSLINNKKLSRQQQAKPNSLTNDKQRFSDELLADDNKTLMNCSKNETTPLPSENTFFFNCNIVCNSTAIQSNKKAYERQIVESYQPNDNNGPSTKHKHNMSNNESMAIINEKEKIDKLIGKSNKDAQIKSCNKKLSKNATLAESHIHISKENCKNADVTRCPSQNINTVTPIKLRKLSQLDDDFVFVTPQARPIKISKSVSEKKSWTKTTKSTSAKLNGDFKSNSNSSRHQSANCNNISVAVLNVSEKSMTIQANKTNSNVSSTTLISPQSLQQSYHLEIKQEPHPPDCIDLCKEDDENDCTVVTSTTNYDIFEAGQQASTSSQSSTLLSNNSNSNSNSNLKSNQSKNYILIYTPRQDTIAQHQTTSNDSGFFQITMEHLSSVIGLKPAEKFLKHYMGRRRFNKNSTIYYKPPEPMSSDSDDDILETINNYGSLYEAKDDSAPGGGYNENSTTF